MGKRVKRTSVKDSLGFTIVETLIVLAVTGLLMLSIIALINGKQKTTEFQTALNNVRSEMQQISSDVVNGSFPDDVKFGCKSSTSLGTGSAVLSTTDDNDGNCTFVGKVIHLHQQSDGSDDDYSVYSMVGLKNDASTYGVNGVGPFLAAKTDGTFSLNNPGNAVGDGITTSTRLQNGLSVRKVSYTIGSNPILSTAATGSFGFVQSLNPGLSGGSSSGTSQHSLLMVFTATGSSITNSQDAEATKIDNALLSGTVSTDTTTKVTICFKSGTTNQWALMTIGSSSQLDIKTTITGTDCSS